MSDRLQRFGDWFLEGGGTFGQHVELHYDPARGFHLRVASDQQIEPDSNIISCPHTLTLSHLNITRGKGTIGAAIQASADVDSTALSSSNLLRFFLVEQYLLKAKSFWWPYIDLLPDSSSACPFNTPLYYDEDDTRWIRGTSLEHSRRMIGDLWKSEYEQGLRLLRQSDKYHYTWDLYKWAATVTASRSFPGNALIPSDGLPNQGRVGSTSVLLPGLDLLNHSPHARVTWRWLEGACCIATNVSLSGGSEIYNNYAPKSNEELIMGYGFSLFKNPSDHCNIALGSMAVSRIHDVSLRRKPDSSCKDSCQAGRQLDKPPIPLPFNTAQSGIGWVRPVLKTSVYPSLKPALEELPIVFSEGFLQQASVAFFNAREQATGVPITDTDFGLTNLTRNKLHTICAIVMILQKQYSDIIIHNVDHPPWPQNQRQFHAARYRRGQLNILRSVCETLVTGLRQVLGLHPSSSRDRRIMCLENILKAGPKDFNQDFRAAIHVGFGTRDPTKIQQQSLAESAFVLWLCGVWIWSLPNHHPGSRPPGRSDLSVRTANWLHLVWKTYGDQSDIGKEWARKQATEESKLLTESHHAIVKIAAAKKPQSIYNEAEATMDRLLWCLRVVREESFMCPGLDDDFGDEADEIILFLEDSTSRGTTEHKGTDG